MEVVCFTLSTQGNVSNLYWACGGIRLLCTEYAGELVIFTLSMLRNSSDLYWVCRGRSEICLIIAHFFHIGHILLAITVIFLYMDNRSLFYTEYAGEFVRFTMSMRRNLSFTYWVCGGIGHIRSEYAEEFVQFILSMRWNFLEGKNHRLNSPAYSV